MDRRLAWIGEPCFGSRHPLAGHEAGAAAELNEELPLTQPVGLHHLAERFVGWDPGKERGRGQMLGPCWDH